MCAEMETRAASCDCDAYAATTPARMEMDCSGREYSNVSGAALCLWSMTMVALSGATAAAAADAVEAEACALVQGAASGFGKQTSSHSSGAHPLVASANCFIESRSAF